MSDTHQINLAYFFNMTQTDWKNRSYARLVDLHTKSGNHKKLSYLPKEISGLVDVTIGYLNLYHTPRFVKGQWTLDLSHPEFKVPFTRRTFKNIDMSNADDVAMLQRYLDGVQPRCMPAVLVAQMEHFNDPKLTLRTTSWNQTNTTNPKTRENTKALHVTHQLGLESRRDAAYEAATRIEIRFTKNIPGDLTNGLCTE
jgi:hypothetical protein